MPIFCSARTVVLIAALLFCALASAQDGPEFMLTWQADPTGKLTVQELLQRPDALWQDAPAHHTLNPGYDTSAFWLRIAVSDQARQPDQLVLEIAFPLLDYVNVYLLDPATGRLVRSWLTGDRLPFYSRPIDAATFAFPLKKLANGRWPHVLIRVQSTGGVQIPVRLHTQNEFVRLVAHTTMANSLYYGIMLLLALLNFLMYWQIRSEMAFFYYAVSCLGMVMLIGSLEGSIFRYVTPDWPTLAHHILLGGIFTVLGALSAFTIRFMSLSRYARPLSGYFRVTAGTALFFLIITPFMPYQTQNLIGVLLAILTLVPMALTGPWCWLHKVPRAALYTLATGILVGGGLLTALANLALLPATPLTRYALQAGSAMNALIFTVALAIRMGEEHRESRLYARRAKASRAAQTQAERALRRSALIDKSTGLPNRDAFMIRLHSSEATRRMAGGVILFDLPKLSQAASTLGGDMIEQAAHQIGCRLGEALRHIPGIQPLHIPDESKSWLLARVERSQFAAILQPGRKLSTAHITKLEHLFDQPVDIRGQRIPLTLRMGVVYGHCLSADPNQWLARANWACDQIPAGNSGLRIYDAQVKALHERRTRISTALEEAIGQDLQLYYQPQLELSSNRIAGVEALVRWFHPELGAIAPDEIVAVALESGLIRQLTDWVLHQGLTDLKRLRQHSSDLRLSINVSARNLEERDFARRVLDALKRHQLACSALCIELTETETFVDPVQAQTNLTHLHEAGVALSLDDFGTGYSNLAKLNAMKLAELKVDRSLVPDGSHPRQEHVLKQTVSIGKAMDCQIVGEGVEDTEQMECLKRAGCDMAQGYFIKRPASRDELQDWLDDFDPWAFGL